MNSKGIKVDPALKPKRFRITGKGVLVVVLIIVIIGLAVSLM